MPLCTECKCVLLQDWEMDANDPDWIQLQLYKDSVSMATSMFRAVIGSEANRLFTEYVHEFVYDVTTNFHGGRQSHCYSCEHAQDSTKILVKYDSSTSAFQKVMVVK